MNALQLVPSCLRRLFYVRIGRGSFELELAWSEAENFAASVLPARVLPGPACLCSVFSVAGRFWLPERSEVPQENKRMAKSQVRFRWTGSWGTGVDQHCRGPRSMSPPPSDCLPPAQFLPGFPMGVLYTLGFFGDELLLPLLCSYSKWCVFFPATRRLKKPFHRQDRRHLLPCLPWALPSVGSSETWGKQFHVETCFKSRVQTHNIGTPMITWTNLPVDLCLWAFLWLLLFVFGRLFIPWGKKGH